MSCQHKSQTLYTVTIIMLSVSPKEETKIRGNENIKVKKKTILLNLLKEITSPKYLSLKWSWGTPLAKVAELAFSKEAEIDTKHRS